jgi:hypothetical protein
MKRDIHKLAAVLQKKAQAGIALENKILAWQRAEKPAATKVVTKAS